MQELSALVEEGKRSHFVAEATREALRKFKLMQGIEQAAGAWKSKEHPELKTQKAVEHYVRELRRDWSNRAKGDPSG